MIDLVDFNTKENLKNYLLDLGAKFKGEKSCTCPFHQDKNPSAGIYESGGKWRFRCHKCDITDDYIGIRAMNENLEAKDIIEIHSPKQTFSLEKIQNWPNLHRFYDYGSDFKVVRTKDKKFLQFKRYGFNFIFGSPSHTELYNKDAISKEKTIVFVEGEKCVDALKYIGLDAVTSAGGANAIKKANLKPLLEAKKVILWPDNDEVGREYTQFVSNYLKKNNIDHSMLNPDEIGLENKEDSADYIIRMKGFSIEEMRKEIEICLDLADDIEAFEFESHLKNLESGVLKSINIGFDCLQASKWLMGGAVTIVCGTPGSAKSWFTHQLTLSAIWNGYNPANLQLEEDDNYHLVRAFQVQSQFGNYCDVDTVTQEEIDEMRAPESKKFLKEYQSHLFTMPETCTKEDVGRWVEDQCEKRDLIIVDSLSVIASGKEVWVEDQLLMNRIKRSAKKFNTRIILITHPKNMGGKMVANMDNLAGGTAYQRLSQCILWLTDLEYGEYECKDSEGISVYSEANKLIKIMKMRNGYSQFGVDVAFNFNKFRFEEVGFMKS